MQLKEIYRPISRELADTEQTIKKSIRTGSTSSVLEVSDYLLNSGGKRLRPALVILSAKAALDGGPKSISRQVINIASAVELVHLASLIHDDVIDHSNVRHNKPTVNAKWGEEVSIILGDYFYSVGFDLISSCRSLEILDVLSHATHMMCKGELVQVCERDNLDLMRERYFDIIKNKTANLFAASCEAGALAVGRQVAVRHMLREYGLNFGIAFQIVDDSLDLIGDAKYLGKQPGTDFRMGELTLPVLNLLSEIKDKKKRHGLISRKNSEKAFKEIRGIFINSRAVAKTEEDAASYVAKAKGSLSRLEDSLFKQSLFALADYVVGRLKNQNGGGEDVWHRDA